MGFYQVKSYDSKGLLVSFFISNKSYIILTSLFIVLPLLKLKNFCSFYFNTSIYAFQSYYKALATDKHKNKVSHSFLGIDTLIFINHYVSYLTLQSYPFLLL